MNCREVVDFLDRYLDGEVAEEERAEFEEHLAECDACVAYLRSYRATRRLAGSLRAEDAVAAMPEDLIRAILSACNRDVASASQV